MKSLRQLFRISYNKRHPLFALTRFIQWKGIRLFKRQNIKYSLWRGRKLYLNYDSFQSMWVMYNYIVDWEEFNLIGRFLRPDDTVFDIGANMGFYTIWMSKFIDNGKIHSFEPDPTNFKKLKKNVELNPPKEKYIISNKAISEKEGTVMFSSGLDGENHLVSVPDGNTVAVQSVNLDNYCAGITDGIRYMKIDVEGFEFAVLKGAKKLLGEKKIDIIQLELNNTISQSGASINDIINILKENNYYLCRYKVDRNCLILTEYSVDRENYFAAYDIESINSFLKDTKSPSV